MGRIEAAPVRYGHPVAQIPDMSLTDVLGPAARIYRIEQQLGSGTYSKVYRAHLIKDSSKKYALKVMDLKPWKLQPGFSTAKVIREVDVMRGLAHENIVQLLEVYETDASIVLVLELVEGGDLFDLILTEALKYLHKKGVVHRDLKPENILVEKTDQWPPIVKIGDFGLAKGQGNNLSLPKTFCGTPQYLAPEILGVQMAQMHGPMGSVGATFSGAYGPEADFWSLGAILYVMLCGQYAFKDGLTPAMVHSQFRANSPPLVTFPQHLWNDISSEAKDLISRLLAVDPRKRYDADECLAHPWLRRLLLSKQNAVPGEGMENGGVTFGRPNLEDSVSSSSYSGAGVISEASSDGPDTGYTVKAAAIGGRDVKTDSAVVHPADIPTYNNARVTFMSPSGQGQGNRGHGWGSQFDSANSHSDSHSRSGDSSKHIVLDRNRMEEMVRKDLKIGELLSLQASIADSLSTGSTAEELDISAMDRQYSDDMKQADRSECAKTLMGASDAAASLNPLRLIRSAANRCRIRHLEALKMVRKFHSTSNSALSLLPDITAAIDDKVVDFVNNVFSKLRTWVTEIKDDSAQLQAAYLDGVNEISTILDSPAVRNLISHVVPRAKEKYSAATFLSPVSHVQTSVLMHPSKSDTNGSFRSACDGSPKREGSYEESIQSRVSSGSDAGIPLGNSGSSSSASNREEAQYSRRVDNAFRDMFDRRPSKRRKQEEDAKSRLVIVSLGENGTSAEGEAHQGIKRTSSKREQQAVWGSYSSRTRAGDTKRTGSVESRGSSCGESEAEKWSFEGIATPDDAGEVLQNSLKEAQDEAAAVRNLRRAFEELQRLENVLGRATQFWMKFESIAAMVLQNDTSAQEYIKYLETSPKLRARFIERIKQMELFWTVFRDVCADFVDDSSDQLEHIYAFL